MRNWIYLQNPFLTATDGNYKLAAKISLFHKNALQAASADAFIGPMNTAYATPNTNLQNAYSAWEAAGGAQKGKTLSVTQLLAQAKTKLDIFEPAILVLYPKTTPEYMAIFPQGRKPFTQGSIDDRVAAFAALETALTGIAALATTKTAVHNFWLSLQSARQQQQTDINLTDAASQAVEAARIAAMNLMYADLGNMIGHYPTLPDTVATYYDLPSIRNHEQLIFTGHLAALGVHEVMKHKFDPTTDSIKVTAATLNSPMQVYFTNGISDEPAVGQPVIGVAPLTSLIINPTNAGYADDKRHLYIKCTGPADGDWEVELV